MILNLRTATLIFSFLVGFCLHAQDKLYMIEQDRKFGFINDKGDIVIPPTYTKAAPFSEGFAAVCINNKYGFINTKGDTVIEPIYDYATVFNEGLGLTYYHGKVVFIDAKGNEVLKTAYDSAEPFQNGWAKVTKKGKIGFINTKGEPIIDVVYSDISVFKDGMAIVEKQSEYDPNSATQDVQFAVIDTNNQIVIPFGKYKEIRNYKNGFFHVTKFTKSNCELPHDFVRANGEELNVKLPPKSYFYYSDFEDGLAPVRLYKTWLDSSCDKASSCNEYTGFINTAGDLVIQDTNYVGTSGFSNGFALIKLPNDSTIAINTKGEIKHRFASSRYLYLEKFKDGLLVVKQGNHHTSIIDTNFNPILPNEVADVKTINNGLITYSVLKTVDGKKELLYGICNYHGEEIIPPIMTIAPKEGFINGIAKCYIGQQSYINLKGEVIWKKEPNTKPIIIDRTNVSAKKAAGYYSQPETAIEDLEAINTVPLFEDSLYLYIDTNTAIVSPASNSKYYNTYLINNLNETMRFSVQDNRLYMNVQAKDYDGNWVDIEYLPNSDCGNSYFSKELNANKYWLLSTYAYKGSFKTRLRIKFQYKNPFSNPKSKDVKTIYSNEFDGSINPGQFWRIEDHVPIMPLTPYFEK